MKIRPEGGFSIDKNLDKKLKAEGFVDTGNLTKEEKLFLLVEGKTKKGMLAYNQGSKYAMELLDNVREFINYVDRPGRRFRR